MLEISSEGLLEVRLLRMGPSEYFDNLVMQLKLVHDFEHVFSVNMKDFLFKDEISPEVILSRVKF